MSPTVATANAEALRYDQTSPPGGRAKIGASCSSCTDAAPGGASDRRMYADETEIVGVVEGKTIIGLPALEELAYSLDDVEDYPITGSWEETQPANRLLQPRHVPDVPQHYSWDDTRGIAVAIVLIGVLIAFVVGGFISVFRQSAPVNTFGQGPTTVAVTQGIVPLEPGLAPPVVQPPVTVTAPAPPPVTVQAAPAPTVTITPTSAPVAALQPDKAYLSQLRLLGVPITDQAKAVTTGHWVCEQAATMITTVVGTRMALIGIVGMHLQGGGAGITLDGNGLTKMDEAGSVVDAATSAFCPQLSPES
jgi:Protein of unknown function (DUF732)